MIWKQFFIVAAAPAIVHVDDLLLTPCSVLFAPSGCNLCIRLVRVYSVRRNWRLEEKNGANRRVEPHSGLEDRHF